MLRNLLLIRHAKSDWGHPSLSDFDRPLNGRGKSDAPIMGDRLAASGIRIDRLVSSPAVRAKTTAEAIAQSIGFPAHDISWMTGLYLASPLDILDIVHTCPNHVRTLAIVSHNPGISELANQLCDTSVGNIPTCGIVHLAADLSTWSEAERFNLLDFDYPKRSL